ncbi:MAG: hypothetical protein CMJ18_23170 [Phycisphaeraceae bacterium]|nr:hypothetical protein [Phycisphaeraceae bacterium]
MYRLFLVLGLLTATLASQQILDPPTDPMRALALSLRRIGAAGRLLYVTAHPDDEDNRLLSYYRHGRGFDVTLLTVTRGDGGQNEIGEELFEGIGALRMEELRAAHRYDGANQRFTRAFEFGYSFSETETFQKWGEEEVLRDVVKIVREVRPHVICTMSVFGTGGGRHHQASAFLARRAFDLAATDTWPELGAPWAVDRLFESGGRTGSNDERIWTVRANQYDPVLGCTYDQLGFRARSFHKCQGTGQVARLSGSTRRNRRRLVRRRGPLPEKRDDLFAGLKVWRDPRTGDLATEPVDVFGVRPLDTAHPERVAHRLRALLREAHPTARPAIFDALSLAMPLHVEAVADRGTMTRGDRVRVRVLVHNRSAAQMTVEALHLVGKMHDIGPEWSLELAFADGNDRIVLDPGARTLATATFKVPETADAWTALKLERAPNADRYIGALDRLHDPFALRVVTLADVDGLPIHVADAPVTYRRSDPAFPEGREDDLALLPPVEVRLDPRVIAVPLDQADGAGNAPITLLVRLRRKRPVQVALVCKNRDGTGSGEWSHIEKFDRSGRRVVLIPIKGTGGTATRFDVTARVLDADGRQLPALACQEIAYPHIRRVYLRRPARAEIVAFPCIVPSQPRIGWVDGSGDVVDECLALVGVPVTKLDATALESGDLSQFDVIVTGVRAYKVRDDLKRAHSRLMKWVADGGRMVVLYNKSPDMNGGRGARGGSPWTPYRARVGRTRVTVEEAPVHYRDPKHPWFHHPNQLTDDDWAGWVQERGLYFLDARHEQYQDLLEIEEPWPGNRGKKRGALVTAPVGKGSWTYIGLALFRQLPAGVPGAYRLLLNILATRKP